MVTDNKVPHVIGALARVQGEVAVSADGTLPSSLGGKPYITANSLFLAVNKSFHENGLVLVPNERVVGEWHDGSGTIHITVTGEYTVYSTEDGSSLTLSGTGDGLARRTAVAGNIASTNALKNTLLRLIFTGESATDEQGKKEVGNENTNHPPASPPPANAARKAARGTDNFRDMVKEEYLDTGLKTKEQVNALWNEFGRDFKKVYAHLESEG